jgi:hypothetical protein
LKRGKREEGRGKRLAAKGSGRGRTTKAKRTKRKPRRVTTLRNRSYAKPSPKATIGPVTEWFELRKSRVAGVGAFALKDIPRGTRLIEYAGELISNGEADRRYPDDDDQSKPHHTFLFVLNKRAIIDAAFDGNEARFINHSCEPNCQANIERGHIWIDAIRRIPAGTELSYDYEYDDDPKYTEKDLLFYACHCGSAKCRGTIVLTRKLLNKKNALSATKLPA